MKRIRFNVLLHSHTLFRWNNYTWTKGFSNRDITILSMNKTQKYLRYWVQIYRGCSASITFYESNSISVMWPLRARLRRSILWTQFPTTLAHISTGTLAIYEIKRFRSLMSIFWLWILIHRPSKPASTNFQDKFSNAEWYALKSRCECS